MLEYERKFGEKLACLFGHSKLYKLMEDLPNTVEVRREINNICKEVQS